MDATPPPPDGRIPLDALPCGYVAFADDGTITAVNATLSAWLGTTAEALVGRHVESILALPSRIFYQTHFFPLLALHGQAEEIFLSLRPPDGDDVPVIAHATRTPDETISRCVLMRARQRKQYEDELRSAKRAAEEALENNTVLRQAQTRLEEQTRELDRQVTRLQHRSEELARLNSILSHDLREPVRKLSLFATMLLEEIPSPSNDTVRWAIDRLVAETERLDVLLTGVRQYVSVTSDATPFTTVSLDAAVDAALDRCSLDTPDGPLVLDRAPLPTIEGNLPQLVTLFQHLIRNAVQFRTPGQPPRMRLYGQVVACNSFRSVENQYRYVECARVVVEDSGIGFAPHYAPQLFLALKKLDPYSPRLGLGLALCKKIVGHHFGTIEAHGTPGRGARFVVQLPLAQG